MHDREEELNVALGIDVRRDPPLDKIDKSEGNGSPKSARAITGRTSGRR